jgi:ribonucleoside-diphosphate reductase beta chain
MTAVRAVRAKFNFTIPTMTTTSILNLSTSHDRLFFGDSGHGISRYDVVRHPIFQKLDKNMKKFFWDPALVDMSSEKRSFESMTGPEQFVFTSNLKRQILLDSVQGRAPMLTFGPFCSDPTLENCLATWGFFETIHSESYTHILRAIYPDPKIVVDDIPNIRQIADCATSIAFAYDTLQQHSSKENLYLALIAANALESLRFYVSFACTFSFSQRGFVEGSAKIVKLIARDETQHVALTQHILKTLPKDDPDFSQILLDCAPKALLLFEEAAEQEKEWAKYLFSEGPILGLSEDILCTYVDHLLHRRTHALGIAKTGTPRNPNPIPWIDKWFTNDNVQVAPQEVEFGGYLSQVALQNDLMDLDVSFLLK